MLILISVLVSVLFWQTILVPFAECQRARVRRESDEYYRLVKLSAVREYYPALQDLSLREIALRYDYDEAYRRMR